MMIPATSVQPIPRSIVKAICRVQASLEAVRKSGKNAHGNYAFASTDDIYAAVTRKLGEVGLVIVALEETAETVRIEKEGKTTQWLKAVYSFILATEEETWHDHRSRRSLYIMINGPQTFQAAQSYAEKAYLRSLLKLPTGDMDLDSLPQADTEEDQTALTLPAPKRKTSSGAKKDGTDAVYNEINRHLLGAHDVEALQHVRSSYAAEWSTMPERWVGLLDDTLALRMTEFGETQVAE